MNYVAFIVTGGPKPAEDVAEMNRDIPAYDEEMERRGVRLLGRELDIRKAAATVRVRNGEVLVSDGPFAETKEFVGGFDLVDCADLDEAIEVEGKSPVARFCPIEIRPVRDRLRLGPMVSAFRRGDDAEGLPFMLTAWAGQRPGTPPDEQALIQECHAWRQELEARGGFVLGGALSGPETATTIRFHAGELELSDGPFLDIDGFIAGIEAIRCADRQQAMDLAATHPFARHHAIEVRAFYSE